MVAQVSMKLQGSADLGILFISSAFASEYARVVPLLTERLPLKVLVGCGGASIIGTDSMGMPQELEDQPALSLSVAHLPDVDIIPFHLQEEDIPDLDSPPEAWIELIGLETEVEPSFLIFADPFSSSINDLLAGLDFAYPHSPKVGGLASADGVGRNNGLFCYDQSATTQAMVMREGTVGVALAGNLRMDTIVAQGCRPIGEPFQISRSERNIIMELATGSDEQAKTGAPLELLRELITTLDSEDQVLAQDSLFIGIAMDGFKQQLSHGDFLIRNLLGVDPKTGAIAIGDRIRPGQRIQFHLRDAETSAEDLSVLLQRYVEGHSELRPPFGAVMFACMGRGRGLYGELNFDANKFCAYLPKPNLGGFFCNGEIGPVGDRTYLHGYTSAFGILYPKS